MSSALTSGLERAESAPESTNAFLAASILPGAFASPTLSDAVAPETEDAVARTMDLILRGSHPLLLYPTADLQRHLDGALDKVLAACWAQQGNRLRHKAAGAVPEAGNAGKAQPPRLEVFLAALAVLPICPPRSWLASAGRARMRSGWSC